jgi:anti-sigma factor RsiW
MTSPDAPRDIACNELVELLTEYLEGTLPASEVAGIEAHLDGCEACGHYLDQMRTTIGALGSVPVETLSDDACDVLLAAFRERSQSAQ